MALGFKCEMGLRHILRLLQDFGGSPKPCLGLQEQMKRYSTDWVDDLLFKLNQNTTPLGLTSAGEAIASSEGCGWGPDPGTALLKSHLGFSWNVPIYFQSYQHEIFLNIP